MFATKGVGERMPWKLLGLETGLIVLSVLLALALHGWYDARTQQARADRALEAAFEETVSNCNDILSVQAYYHAVSHGERRSEGLRLGPLRSESWQVLVAAEAMLHLNFEVAQTLAAIHDAYGFDQEIRGAYLNALFRHLLSEPNVFEEQGHPTGERHVIADLYRGHKRLVERYARLIDLVGERYTHLDLDPRRCTAARDEDLIQPR